MDETRQSGIRAAYAMRLVVSAGQALQEAFWDVENTPTRVAAFQASPGQAVTVDKLVAVVTSRDTDRPVEAAIGQVQSIDLTMTVLRTLEDARVIVPNRRIVGWIWRSE